MNNIAQKLIQKETKVLRKNKIFNFVTMEF